MPDNLFINKTMIFTKEELDNLYNQVKNNQNLDEKDVQISFLTSNYKSLIKYLSYDNSVFYLKQYLTLIEDFESQRNQQIILLKEEKLNIKNFILKNKEYNLIKEIENQHMIHNINKEEIIIYLNILEGENGEKIFEEMKKQQLNKKEYENTNINFDLDNIAGIPGLI